MASIARTCALSILALAIAALAATCFAAEVDRPRIEYRLGKIRVFYATEGLHKVGLLDRDQNGVPDQVEDLAKQTWAAYSLFVETLGFPNPFTSERFRVAAFLDIHLIDRSVLKNNGVAFDELQRFNRPTDPPNTQTLCFNVATSVKASSNLTPAHEFFHLIQSGATYFKNAWFTEGTARWSEKALGAGALGVVRYNGPWPLADARRDAVFAKSYDASVDFWNPLALIDDPVGDIPEERIKPELRQLTYSSGLPVLQDRRLHGWAFMRDVLLELGKVDDVAYRELGYSRWSEANQNSPQNNRYIYQAVLEVARRHGHKLGQ